MRKSRATEIQEQRAAVEALQLAGFRVLQTSQFQAAKGSDRGIPDLIVQHELCGPVALMMEFKRPGQAVRFTSPEQEELHERGLSVIAQSPQEAVAHAHWFLGSGYKLGRSNQEVEAAVARVVRVRDSLGGKEAGRG